MDGVEVDVHVLRGGIERDGDVEQRHADRAFMRSGGHRIFLPKPFLLSVPDAAHIITVLGWLRLHLDDERLKPFELAGTGPVPLLKYKVIFKEDVP